MAWRRENRMLPTTRQVPDGWVQVVIGQIGTRFCGCSWEMGVRSDNMEPVFGARITCPAHVGVGDATMRRMQQLPPSDREVGSLFEELFEQEVLSHATN